MIGYLSGSVKLTDLQMGVLIVNQNQIGYWVKVPASLQSLLIGSELSVYTHLQVSENDQVLWGFDNLVDLRLFKLLLSVSGVGPSTAMSLISTKGSPSIVNAILEKDAGELKVSGVGPKTTQKIIIDLIDKITKLEPLVAGAESKVSKTNRDFEDAVAALVQLGYKSDEVVKYFDANKQDLHSSDTANQIKSFLSNIRVR